MDNFQFDITGQDQEAFKLAMTLAFTQHKAADAYKIFIEPVSSIETLSLYCTPNKEVVQLPYPMKLDYVISFVWGWLETVKYPPEPDIDGTVKKGFRVCSKPWGGYPGYGGIAAIQPWWAIYHK